jgi:hypothetical protein
MTMLKQMQTTDASTASKPIETVYWQTPVGRDLQGEIYILTDSLPDIAGAEIRNSTYITGRAGAIVFQSANAEPGNVFRGLTHTAAVILDSLPPTVAVIPLWPQANASFSPSKLPDTRAFAWNFAETDDDVRTRFGQETYDLAAAAVETKERMTKLQQKKAIRKIAKLFSRFTD